MILLMVMGVVLVGMLCVTAYTLAIYALPFMLGLLAARFAYATGAGLLGAGVVGLAAGAAGCGLLLLLFTTLRSPLLRLIVALIFATPAAVAGYFLVHGIVREAIPSEIWRRIISVTGSAFTGLSALERLTAPAQIRSTRSTEGL